jgi:hypothetical protein
MGQERGKKDRGHDEVHIFVNRRKFEEEDGIQKEMTGRQIAALVGVPPDLAVVRRGNTGSAPEVGLDEVLKIKNAEHFLVTRKVVEGGYEIPERIRRELAQLAAGGQLAQFIAGPRDVILYREVPVSTRVNGLPTHTDVIVPVPAGYPASMIDLAGLPVGSPLLPRVAGGSNNQGIITVEDRQFQLASYHPHNNGGGPPWDQTKHGFHTYFDHILAWLAKVA